MAGKRYWLKWEMSAPNSGCFPWRVFMTGANKWFRGYKFFRTHPNVGTISQVYMYIVAHSHISRYIIYFYIYGTYIYTYILYYHVMTYQPLTCFHILPCFLIPGLSLACDLSFVRGCGYAFILDRYPPKTNRGYVTQFITLFCVLGSTCDPIQMNQIATRILSMLT